MVCKLDTGIQAAEENMRRDGELLQEISGDPILHLYDWEGPSVTYGHFIIPEKHLCLDAVRENQISLARRPTGGGIVFHLWDYAFSFLMPSSHPLFSLNTLENYAFVNKVVLEAVREMFDVNNSVELLPQSMPIQGADCGNFCMARPTQYDVVYQGRKIAGAAQRRTKRGYLHQGTISLALPCMNLLQSLLLNKKDVMEAMGAYSFAPLQGGESKSEVQKIRKEMGELLYKVFSQYC